MKRHVKHHLTPFNALYVAMQAGRYVGHVDVFVYMHIYEHRHMATYSVNRTTTCLRFQTTVVCGGSEDDSQAALADFYNRPVKLCGGCDRKRNLIEHLSLKINKQLNSRL